MSKSQKSDVNALSPEQRAARKTFLAALTPEQRAAAKANAAAYKKLTAMGRKLLDKHVLKSWKFCIAMDDEPGFFEQRSDGYQLHGQCCHSEKSITVHYNLRLKPRDAKQVILHEIAHVLVRRRYGKNGDDDHGPRFTKLARKLGCRTWSSVGQYEHVNFLKRNPELLQDPVLTKHVRGLLWERSAAR